MKSYQELKVGNEVVIDNKKYIIKEIHPKEIENRLVKVTDPKNYNFWYPYEYVLECFNKPLASTLKNGQCKHYHHIGMCACNNDPDDYGDCIFEDGIRPRKPDLDCKHYDPFYNIKKVIPENWQDELERLCFQNKRDLCRKRAYICSPCRADTQEGVIDNMKAARFYMYCAHTDLHMNASAPHAYLPTILCDKVPAERALALNFCLKLIETGGTILICGNRITPGMKEEISHAAKLGMEIQVFNASLYVDVQKIATKAGADKKLVVHDNRYPILAMSPEEITRLPEVS